MCCDCLSHLNPQGRNLLERHRADYAAFTGSSFEHFFCPITFEDAPAKLIRGHIINEGFKGSPNAWVIQRGAADHYYGAYFEGDFELTQHTIGATPLDYLFDKKLFNSMAPSLLIKGERRRYFIRENKPPPPGFEIAVIEYKGRELELCLQATPEELETVATEWTVDRGRDLRLPALVSLIKAAHLSMFSLFGYRYALSYAGRFIGEDILGKFYRVNQRTKTKREVQRRAFPFFKPFMHMIRPIQPGTTEMEGTLSDGLVSLCASASGEPWAMVIFIKTGELRNAALIPYPENAEAFGTYLDFLKNDRENIHVMRGVYEGHQWTFEKERRLLFWPKDGDIYPQRIQ